VDLQNTIFDELQSPLRVMHIPRSVIEVEELFGLRDGTEERVVTSSALLLFVVPDSGTLGVPPGGEDAAVEVQCDACGTALAKPFKHEIPIGLSEANNSGLIN
jgi:hypothetical protein